MFCFLFCVCLCVCARASSSRHALDVPKKQCERGWGGKVQGQMLYEAVRHSSRRFSSLRFTSCCGFQSCCRQNIKTINEPDNFSDAHVRATLGLPISPPLLSDDHMKESMNAANLQAASFPSYLARGLYSPEQKHKMRRMRGVSCRKHVCQALYCCPDAHSVCLADCCQCCLQAACIARCVIVPGLSCRCSSLGPSDG